MHSGPTDPRIPAADRVVHRYILERHAEERPTAPFLVFLDGTTWTYAQARLIAEAAGAALHAFGVRQYEHVATFLPNGVDALRVWWGLNHLGAVYAPVNPAYRGQMLAHVINESDARLLVVHAGLLERLRGLPLESVTTLVVVGGETDAAAQDLDGFDIRDGGALQQPGSPVELATPIAPWDTQAIWYTSGTTGAAKAVLSSYQHAYSMFGPETFPFIGSDDRYMINLPVFHMGGAGLMNSMLLRGGSASFVESFSASQFLDQVRSTRSTTVFLLGVMGAFLEAQPAQPSDTDNPLSKVFIIPMPNDPHAFARRFGVDVYSIYNMTEICSPIISTANAQPTGTCGRVRAGVEVRLVDGNDCEVPIGEVGEFIVRSDVPWSMNHGYYKRPEATARAWRNGWFHTGDAGRQDADGNFFFVDRIKDAIRRRGEFVSSLELEVELCAHPGVATAAVIGVPSEIAEEEIMAVIVPADSSGTDPEALVHFLAERTAHFMIPRYFRFVDSLPMTPTEKIRKTVLRDEGISTDTWDRHTAGLIISRGRLTRVVGAVDVVNQ
jgi:crotonobetaine/carnitine-CoA ligase